MARRRPRAVNEYLYYDKNRLWYRITGYRGYEISNDNHLRSVKLLYNQGGCLLTPVTKTTYELTSDDGDRHRLTLAQIWELADSNPYNVGNLNKTYVFDAGGRNSRKFQNKKKYTNGVGETTFMPRFTVIKESSRVITPIYDISGRGINYGSK